jgi:hypothetical protein
MYWQQFTIICPCLLFHIDYGGSVALPKKRLHIHLFMLVFHRPSFRVRAKIQGIVFNNASGLVFQDTLFGEQQELFFVRDV